jgi:hypothetical protein
MEKAFEQLGMFLLLVVVSGVLGMLLAFPIKWSWNYTVVYVWHLPVITWGHAWCLSFLSGLLVQSSLSHNSSK